MYVYTNIYTRQSRTLGTWRRRKDGKRTINDVEREKKIYNINKINVKVNYNSSRLNGKITDCSLFNNSC